MKISALGVQSILDASIDSGIRRVVFISIDKAVNPVNTIGKTKLLGEKLITVGNKHSVRWDLRLVSVRFGDNVNSSQSEIPLFVRQIRSGNPVTFTDERMTRCLLTYDDVFDLIDQTMDQMLGGEVFVYDMDAMRMLDLTEAMIEVLSPRFGYKLGDIGVEIFGRRVGETIHEDIMAASEMDRRLENDSLYRIPPETTEYLQCDAPDAFD